MGGGAFTTGGGMGVATCIGGGGGGGGGGGSGCSMGGEKPRRGTLAGSLAGGGGGGGAVCRTESRPVEVVAKEFCVREEANAVFGWATERSNALGTSLERAPPSSSLGMSSTARPTYASEPTVSATQGAQRHSKKSLTICAARMGVRPYREKLLPRLRQKDTREFGERHAARPIPRSFFAVRALCFALCTAQPPENSSSASAPGGVASSRSSR